MTIKQQLKRQSSLAVMLMSGLMPLMAQTVTPITLNEAIEMAVTNNQTIRAAQHEQLAARAQYKQTQAIFLPQISASYSAMTTDNPLNAFGFSLQQEGITAADFNPDLLNNPSETQNFMAAIEVRQPILNIDLIYQRKAAMKQQEIYGYKAQRTKEYIRFETQKSYWQLRFAHQAAKVIEEALTTAQSVYEFTNKRFEQGLIQKSDLLNVQVQVKTLESKLAEARSGIQNASDHLALVMGKPSEDTLLPTDSIDTQSDAIILPGEVSNLRADLLAMQKAIDATGMMQRSKQMALLPRINAFAAYQFNDAQVTGFGAESHIAGIQLSWTIFNGTQTHHQIAEQRFKKAALTEQLSAQQLQSQAELQRTLRGINDSKTKIEQNKVSVAQSDEVLRILRNRYEQGLVNTTDVLMSQSQLAMLQLAYQQAVLEWQVGNAYAAFLTTQAAE